MYDQLFPDAAEQSYSAKLLRPVEPQSPKFSTWGFLSAAPKGIAAGAAQAMASTADVGSAIGDKLPANIQGPFGKIPIIAGIQSVMQAGADMLQPKEGQFTSEIGTSLRNVARDYMPDPLTTHASERVVADLFRVGSKAITAAVTMGNIPGAVVAGAEEGFTMADDLARQGVDVQTRTKVGAVNAALNAGAFALPVAGKTWAQTGALALAGGPAAFVTQTAATRKILQDADYTRQADQYDPFDPVGLTLSTLVPLGFGALAMRGRAKGKTISPDVEDAARVSLLRENVDQANPAPERLDTAEAHVRAYAKAMDQMADGRRVEVAEMLPSEVFQPARMLDMELERLQARREELTGRAGDLADPGAVRQVREELDALRAARPDDSETGVRAMAKDIQAADGVSYKQALSSAKDDMAGMVSDYEAKVQRLEDAIKRNAESQKATDELNKIGHQIENLQAQRAEIDAPDLRQNPVAEAARMVVRGQEPDSSGMGANFMDWMKRMDSTMEDMRGEMSRLRQTGPDQPTQPKPVDTPKQKPEPAQAQQAQAATKNVAENGPSGTAEPNAQRSQEGSAGSTDADAYVQAESKRIAMENPDMPVLLEGMDSPAPLSEVMARIEQELQADLADVPLLKVAAECFIQSGAGAV